MSDEWHNYLVVFYIPLAAGPKSHIFVQFWFSFSHRKVKYEVQQWHPLVENDTVRNVMEHKDRAAVKTILSDWHNITFNI